MTECLELPFKLHVSNQNRIKMLQMPQYYHFRNALHFGWFSTSQNLATSKHPIPMRAQVDEQVALHQTPFIKRQSNRTNHKLNGLGLSICDSSVVVIAKWKDGHIAGKYFIFNPDYLSTENKGNKLPAEVCFYGSMENGMLEGDNYIASLGGFRAKGVFRNGKLNGQCLLVRNAQKGDSSDNVIVYDKNGSNKEMFMELMTFRDNVLVSSQQTDIAQHNEGKDEGVSGNGKKGKVVNISKLDLRKTKRTQQGVVSSRIKDVKWTKQPKPECLQLADGLQSSVAFLESMLNEAVQAEELSTLPDNINKDPAQLVEWKMKTRSIGENEVFVGWLHNEIYSQDEVTPINGFGVVFRDGWPIGYGQYHNGKLHGLGRKGQPELRSSQGMFQSGVLMQGFKIDAASSHMSFGYKPKANVLASVNKSGNDINGNNFNVIAEYDTINRQEIGFYKRFTHLKSLSFINNYFDLPAVAHLPLWPHAILNQLNSNRGVVLGRSFREGEISSIERGGQSSANMVERELINHLSPINQIEEGSFGLQNQDEPYSAISLAPKRKQVLVKNLPLDSEPVSQPFRQYIREYHKLSQLNKSSKQPQQVAVSAQNYFSQNSSKIYEQSSSSPEKQAFILNFGDLITDYTNCETERRKLLQTCIKQDRLKQPSSVLCADKYLCSKLMRASRSQMENKHVFCPFNIVKEPEQSVDLDRIYSRFLKKF